MQTCHPVACTQSTSPQTLCHGSPHFGAYPPGIRTTMGAAKRLCVRHRIVPQLLSCSVAGSAYLRNWISATGRRPDERQADRATDDALLREAGVEHPSLAEGRLQPHRGGVHATLGAHVLSEEQHPGVGGELVLQRPPDGGEQVDASGLGYRHLAARRESVSGRGEPADQLKLRGTIGPGGGIHVPGHVGRLGLRPRQRGSEGRVHVRLDLRLDRRDGRLRQHPAPKEPIQLGQRIAGLLLGQALLALVRLGVLRRMPAQPRHGEPEQGGALARPNVGHRLLEQTSGLGGLGAVAVPHQEIPERGEVGRDVAARRLEAGRNRDAVAVVLYIEEQRQGEGRGDRQRRPEAIGRDGGLAAQHHRDRAVVAAVAQDVTMVGDALCPPDRRRVLGADVPGHREHDGAVRLRADCTRRRCPGRC